MNNRGFTLVGAVIIAATLGAVVTTGIVVTKYRSNKIESAKNSIRGDLVTRSVSAVTESSANKTGGLQFAQIQNTTGTNVGTNTITSDTTTTEESAGGGTTTGGTAPTSCTYPCHLYTDPLSNTTACIISDADCSCLGYCPANCQEYVPHGPLSPAVAAATGCNTIPACNAPREVQCGCADKADCANVPLGKNNTCVFPRIPICDCPGGISDCGTGVTSCTLPEVLHGGPWGNYCAVPSVPSTIIKAPSN